MLKQHLDVVIHQQGDILFTSVNHVNLLAVKPVVNALKYLELIMNDDIAALKQRYLKRMIVEILKLVKILVLFRN